jgi:hypothetical protein
VELLVGLITAFTVAYGEIQLSDPYSGFIHDWCLFIIIPIPAIIFGLVAGSGVTLSHLVRQKPVTCRSSLLAIFCALVALFGSYYVAYITWGPDGASSFPAYFYQLITSNSVAFSYKSHAILSLSSPFWSWVYLGIIAMGYMFGSVVTLGHLAGRGYCDDCGRYRRRKKLEEQSWQEWENQRGSFTGVEDSSGFLESYQGKTDNAIARTALHYCSKCYSGFLSVKPYVETKKGWKELDKFEEKIDVDQAFVRSTLKPKQTLC